MTKEIKGKTNENPLGFSCKKMSKYFPRLCAGKLRNEIVLGIIREHIKESFLHCKCHCFDNLLDFVKFQQKKEKEGK